MIPLWIFTSSEDLPLTNIESMHINMTKKKHLLKLLIIESGPVSLEEVQTWYKQHFTCNSGPEAETNYVVDQARTWIPGEAEEVNQYRQLQFILAHQNDNTIFLKLFIIESGQVSLEEEVHGTNSTLPL